MATILPPQQYSQPAGFPQTLQASAPAAPPQANDPLFDALVKYVTSGVDAMPVSSSAIEEHLSNYTAIPDGRAYLESLISTPSQLEKFPEIKAWKYHLSARGFIHIAPNRLILDFSARHEGGVSIPLAVMFEGSAPGIYRPQSKRFVKADFYMDPAPASRDEWTFKVAQFLNLGLVLVSFHDKTGTEVAQLWLTGISIFLPPMEPEGTGLVQVVQ